MQATLKIFTLTNLPLVRAGDDLAELIDAGFEHEGFLFRDDDIVVVAQKIVSLAEDRLVQLARIEPSPAAIELAAETEKDPRLVELILRESSEIVRKKPGVLIVRHRLGLVGANAGIDQSNVDHSAGECALLLPEDPDRSAGRLRKSLMRSTGKRLGVILSDSMNRPWRLGSTGTAIGSAGVTVLDDRRGEHDLFGRELKVTIINNADAIAAAAVLVMGETTERIPVAIVRGLQTVDSEQIARDCIRPVAEDLFR